MSKHTCELSSEQIQTVKRLVTEAEEGQKIIARRSTASSFSKLHQTPLGEWRSPKDRLNIDLAAVEVDLILEKWRRLIALERDVAVGLAGKTFPPPPPPPPPLPTQLGPFSWNPITFDNGVAVGGWAELTLFQDGTTSFNGHFHDSGAASYNSGIVWVFKDAVTNVAFTVQHSGHMAGTFESGSRDDNWNQETAPNAELASAWPTLCQSWSYNAQAQMNGDFNAILGEALSGVGTVLSVVALLV